uniref:Uncharacterized protein n=1 Tax=Arundo donax TaxID=35708 RepID=A0A0A9BTD1_ARUDO
MRRKSGIIRSRFRAVRERSI